MSFPQSTKSRKKVNNVGVQYKQNMEKSRKKENYGRNTHEQNMEKSQKKENDGRNMHEKNRVTGEKVSLKDHKNQKPFTEIRSRATKSLKFLPAEDDLQITKNLYVIGRRIIKFHTEVTWHHVDGKYMNRLVNRLAAPPLQPCSRGHSVGAEFSQDNEYYSYAMSRPDTGYSSFSSSEQAYKHGQSKPQSLLSHSGKKCEKKT